MARSQEIITNVRYRLNDTVVNNQRWSDVHLLRLLNSGIRDVVRRTRTLTDTILIPLANGQSTYTLPANLIEVKALIYREKELPLTSSRQIDARFGLRWRVTTTENSITYVVYDKINSRQLRVYPIPLNTSAQSAYTIAPSPTGFDVSISSGTTPLQLYGIISGVTTDGVNTTTPYGVFTGNVVAQESLVLVYERYALPVLSLADDPETPETLDQALEYWVAGQALRADTNQENRAFGAEELKQYYGDVKAIEVESAKSNLGDDHQRVHYNGMGF